MSPTTRHFGALMRKNFINWKREPCSAACQLVCPGMLMLILVYVRSRISPTYFDSTSLAILETPQFQIDMSADNVLNIDSTNERMTNFTQNYLYNFPTLKFDALDVSTSPLNFYPTNCMYNNSWVLPKVASPLVAIVGDLSANPVMNRINNYMVQYQAYWAANEINNLTLVYYDTLDDLNTYIASDTYLYPDEGVCFGISVEKGAGGEYEANLIFDDQKQFGGSLGVGVPPTNDPAYDAFTSTPNTNDYDMLTQYGYAFAQNLVTNVILQETTGVMTASVATMNIPLPSENVVVDQFSSILSGLFPFFLVLIYMGPIYTTVYGIVREKEVRSKESMRMMGLTDLPYWLSWFAFYTLQSTVITLVGWACLCINVMPNGGHGYIFLYMWLFGEAIFGQIIFYQALFSRAKYAGLISVLVFFMLLFLNLPIAETGSYGLKLILSLVPQVTCQQMAVIWSDFETSQIGINSVTAKDIVNNYSFREGLWMYVPGCAVFALFGFYLDAVLPKEFGTRRHPCFMFFPSTYTGCCKRGGGDDDADQADRRDTLLKKDHDDAGGMEVKNLKPENYEPVAAEVARQGLDGQYLRIEGLEKTYDNGFQAVNGINVKIYQNQIFALLGQNGAGKSTTISMLTGLIQATKGTATAFNFDMFKEPEKVRQFMGICPQHDVLFDNLTPIEHLSVFYDFKGGKPELKEKEINDLIKDVGLTADMHKRAGSLSGGNKRKLSVAIALCGGSKLVLLDEPTAGMDLGARRDLWTMLKNYRRDKIIILTTHYMDEADVLGDRIGIMAKGKMMCLGTSLFLKKRFGAGYKLTMVKNSKKPNTLIEPYLKENLGQVELLSEVSSEITFQVSNESAHRFTKFFSSFDNELNDLGIISYGVSITTLEEVFLKINKEFQINIGNAAAEDRQREITGQEDVPEVQMQEGDIPEREPQDEGDSRTSLNDSSRPKGVQAITQELDSKKVDQDLEGGEDGPQRLVGNSTLASTVKALLIKRFHLYKRDKTGICCEVVVPFMCVIIGCIFNGIDFAQKSVIVDVTPSVYPLPQRILMNSEAINDTSAIEPSTLFANLPGGSSDWEVTYRQDKTSYGFYEDVYAQRLVGNENPYRFGSYEIYKSDQSTHTYQFASFINLTSPVVTAYYPQYMYESVLTSAADVELNQQTYPFPPMYQLLERSNSQSSFGYAGYVGFAFCFMPCAIISFILIERVENQRHMQLISGMSLSAYWVSNMIADMIKLYIPIIIIILVSILFDSNYDGVWILYMLLPPALVPFTYVTSFLFKTDSNAQIITLLLNYFVCDVMAILVFVLQFIPQTFKLGGILRWGLCIFPSYCVLNGILWSSNGQISLQVRKTDPSYPQLPDNIWALENMGGDALILVLHFIIDTGILIAIESNLLSCLKGFSAKQAPAALPLAELKLDDDVIAEEERVRQDNSEVIRVCDFRKAYTTAFGTPFLAVERISFGLNYGECFALLGVNGAGKSTTFKSLTADTEPTTGTITVSGYDITTQFEEARKLIGYCPQKDAIFNLMTVEEHLWFYARIKGIPESMQNDIVEKAIEELNLSDHRTKPAGTLSGGNKRKLSVAMATMGNPPIILLDEPSAGMDPEARRFMWTVVEKISQRDKKSAVILTTHSMEEAEALSTKMGIMVRGGIFKCYGSSQHIKNKYGTGYECEIKIRKPSYADLEQLAEQIGFKQQIDQRIEVDEAKEIARKANCEEMIIEQIKQSGLGSDLIFESQQAGGRCRIANFVNFIFTMQYGWKATTLLCKHFSKVELIEQCSDFFKFRIPREDKTIGSLFGLIEDQKKECNISEYSVSQTSLEQIFQTFAVQSIQDDKATLTFTLDAMENLRLVEERRSTFKGQRSTEGTAGQGGIE